METEATVRRNTIAMILLVPIVYLLSIGPASRILSDNPTGHEGLYGFYAPLQWLAPKSKTYQVFMFWYLKKWGVRMDGPNPPRRLDIDEAYWR